MIFGQHSSHPDALDNKANEIAYVMFNLLN